MTSFKRWFLRYEPGLDAILSRLAVAGVLIAGLGLWTEHDTLSVFGILLMFPKLWFLLYAMFVVTDKDRVHEATRRRLKF